MAASTVVNGWNNAETLSLLEIWGREDIQALLDGTIRDKKVYLKISKELANMGHEKSKQQVQDKIKRFRRDYKLVQDNKKKTGRGRKTCEFYEQIDAILGHKPSINPPEGSILESSHDNDESEGNLLDSDEEIDVADVSQDILPPTPPAGPSLSKSGALQAFAFLHRKRSTSTSDDEGKIEDEIATPKSTSQYKVRRKSKKQSSDVMSNIQEIITYQKESDRSFLELLKESQLRAEEIRKEDRERENRIRSEERAHELQVLQLLTTQMQNQQQISRQQIPRQQYENNDYMSYQNLY